MSAAYSRSSMKSKQPPPSARHARPRAPEPSEPHGSALQVRICSSSCLSWLHLLKSWSLRQSRGGSVAGLAEPQSRQDGFAIPHQLETRQAIDLFRRTSLAGKSISIDDPTFA